MIWHELECGSYIEDLGLWRGLAQATGDPVDLAATRRLRDRFGADVVALLDQGRLLPATDYINAQRLRRAMQGEFAELWSRVDCLFTPTAPITAPRIGETTVTVGAENEDVRLAATRLVRAINALGLPAVSIPFGADRRGLPIGLQIVGQPFAEALILRVAQALVPEEVPVPPL